MKPLKITFYMRGPIAVTNWILLDGLLAAAKMKMNLKDDYYNFSNKQTDLPKEYDLPLLKRNDVYCASIGFGDSIEAIGSWCKRWHDNDEDMVKAYGKAKNRIHTGSGHFKSYHMPMVLKSFKEIVFYANGDKEKIDELLTYINNIGKKNSQGYGEINRIIVEEIPEDYSQFKDGALTRPIPMAHIQTYNNYRKGLFSIMPPYWRTDMLENCYLPD